MSVAETVATRLRELAPPGRTVGAQILAVSRLLQWQPGRTRRLWYEEAKTTVEEWLDVETARREHYERQARYAQRLREIEEMRGGGSVPDQWRHRAAW